MSKPIYVLGTGLSHDGSVCLLKDGIIVAAIEKERLTRRKHDGYNDKIAMQYCLDKEGIHMEDISLIVQNSPTDMFDADDWNYGERLMDARLGIPVAIISHHLAHAYSAIFPSGFTDCAVMVIDGSGNFYEDCLECRNGKLALPAGNDFSVPKIYKENNSYYSFKDEQCVPIFKDFSASATSSDSHFSPFTIHSVGDVYAALSIYCFNNQFDAGKLMGLAPYGDPKVFKENMFELKDGVVRFNFDVVDGLNMPSTSHAFFKQHFQYYADIASWAQRELERAVLYLLNTRYEMYPSDCLAYAGGVALNAVVNARILDETPYKKLFIQPAAGDNGVAIGCAFYGWHEILKKPRASQSSTTCFGKVYDNRAIKNAINILDKSHDLDSVRKRANLFFHNLKAKSTRFYDQELSVQFDIPNVGSYRLLAQEDRFKGGNALDGTSSSSVTMEPHDFYKCAVFPFYFNTVKEKIVAVNRQEVYTLLGSLDLSSIKEDLQEEPLGGDTSKYLHYQGLNYIEEAAQLLSAGHVVGWFQDECEFGPRALGHRSILADPRKKGVRDFINSEIKLREDFRPFAPSVPLDEAANYFDIQGESPYMISVATVRPEWKKTLAEVVHQDDSARVQTVTADWNPKYYKLLKEFSKRSGISVLLNTSLNGRAMPIVETPFDALDFFYTSRMDYMVIQDHIFKRDV